MIGYLFGEHDDTYGTRDRRVQDLAQSAKHTIFDLYF